MPSKPKGNELRKQVVVIDDDEVMQLSCREVLTRAGYEVETFGNGRDGIRRVREVLPPVLVVDLKMPEIDGFEVIQKVREHAPGVVIVVITGYATIATAVDALREGAYDFLPKPFTPAELRLIIDRAFERWRLVHESERLRREKEEVQRRFVTFVSHQLKSPLAAVRQYLDVLLYTQGQDLPEQAKEWIVRSHARVGEMLAIIDDWLTLSRLERGLLAETGAAVAIGPLIHEVVEAQRVQAEGGQVSLSAEVAPDLPAVRGDETSVRMVLANLVHNAIKYNRAGGSVTVRAVPAGDKVELTVADTGIGIAEQHLPEIFTEFWRARTPLTRDIPGTGLGLAICQKVVSELGGSIRVQSREGAGSTFVAVLPVSGAACQSQAGDHHEHIEAGADCR